MKTLYKTITSIGIVALLVFGVSATANAQSRNYSKNTSKRNSLKLNRNSRISSSRVNYKRPTKKVVAVRNIPNRKVVTHRGVNYYYANNRFYTYSRGRYVNIAPRVGFRISTLPRIHTRIVFNNHVFFNVDGIFYSQVDEGYEVVEPEVGTIVYELPTETEKVEIDGLTYYEYANVLYEKVQVDGTRAYEVVGIIELE